jgi:hypothetical protein
VESTNNFSFLTEDASWEVHYYTFQTPEGPKTYWFERPVDARLPHESPLPMPLIFPHGGVYKGLKNVRSIHNRPTGPTYVVYDLVSGKGQEYDLYTLLHQGEQVPYRPPVVLTKVAH